MTDIKTLNDIKAHFRVKIFYLNTMLFYGIVSIS